MNIYANNNIKRKELFVIIFLLIFNPLLGLIFGINKVWNKVYVSKNNMILFMLALAFFLGFINSTKIATSDTISYLDWFSNVDRTNPINSFFYYRGDYSISEPMFVIISIVFNYLTFGSTSIYLFLCTFLIYILQFVAIYNVADKFKLSTKITVCLILSLAFYNPLFLQSVHGLRQIMATAILMFAISRRVVTGKTNWFLLLAAFLTHTSIIAYIPIITFPFCYKNLSLFRACLISGALFALIYGYSNIAGSMQISGFTYISQTGDKIANTADHNQMELSLRGFYIYNIPILSLAILSIFKRKNEYPEITVYYILYILTFIIVVANPVSTEVSIRFAFFVCSFFPYCIMAFGLSNKRLSDTLILCITVLIILIFFYLIAGDPNYPNVIFQFLKPIPLFW